MTVRPCDLCGGRYWVPGHGILADRAIGCRRCEPGPWLVDSDGSRYKPDPSTVFRWCTRHSSVVPEEMGATEEHCVGWFDDPEMPEDWNDCERVWIARPDPLELAE